MKTRVGALIAVLAAIVGGLAAGATLAQEQPLRFLRALQDNGYGDMAVEYLKTLDKQPDLPQEIRDVWDLEMSKSLKTAAAAAFDAKEYEALMEESQKHLAKFLKEKPDHPDATIAMASWGDFLMKRALERLRSAKTVGGKDQGQKEQSEKYLTDARAGLGDARDKFEQAEKKFQSQLAELPPPSQLPAKRAERARVVEARDRAEANLHETQFQLALIEYYLAQTYSDPKSDDRIAALKKAANALDDLYQRNRGSVIGLYAHTWHGKTAEELGDLSMALDIYDEVLANAPEPTERGPTTGLESLFAQVESFRLLIVARQKPQQFLPEATAWLKDYRRFKQTEGYQGIVLNAAKAMLALAEKATGPEKTKLTSEVLQWTTDGAKVRSQYQQEIVGVRQEVLKLFGRDLEANTFEEAVVAGEAAVAGSDWRKAEQAYKKAIELADKATGKDPGGIAAVREALGRVQFLIAYDLFTKGKWSECVDLVGKIVHDDRGNVKKGSAAAARASALGVTAALNLYVAAPDGKKPAALEKLMRVAEFTEKNWPDQPEADDARIARGQAKLVVGQVREAIAIFDRVNPKSERYAAAMYMAGQNYWRLYVTEKRKAQGAPDKDQMAVDRAKAKERLTGALGILKREFEPGKPLPKYMLETQLLLAEIHNEGGEAKEAAALYQPLVDIVQADKPRTFDANTIRIFLGAVRAYCALDELDKASAVSVTLIELGPDTPPVNEVLIEFAKLLNLERKKADARVTELAGGVDAGELSAAKTRLASVRQLLGKTLVKLSQRQELGLGHMMFVGETLNTIGMTAEASEQFQKILRRTQTDSEFAHRAEKAMSLIRTELLTVLRQQEKFDEAINQVDQLIKENPKALEPLMEKGRILEAWAEKDPTKFQAAVEHWTMLRNRLQAIRKKPAEYYEVMYNVAKCLVCEAQQSKDPVKVADCAKKAEQVLKSALVLSPKLSGPDTVAKYKVLLGKAIAMQGRSPEQKDGKKP